MTGFSTGARDLDYLLEELRAGDNVVFYVGADADYDPFVQTMTYAAQASPRRLVYVRSLGQFDALCQGATTVDLRDLADDGSALDILSRWVWSLSQDAYVLFEPLRTYEPWLGSGERLANAFTTLCPRLYELDSVAYWAVTKGTLAAGFVAAILDCTQVFIDVTRTRHGVYVTPTKVWGRFSDTMFRSHRVHAETTPMRVEPQPLADDRLAEYSELLAAKNQELAQIRDELNATNQVLSRRNAELEVVNRQLSEQSRAYRSLRLNIDHLVELLRAGQDIGSSLMIEQVRRAIVETTVRLFEVNACRLTLWQEGQDVVTLEEGEQEALATLSGSAWAAECREWALREGQATSACALNEPPTQSLAVAPLVLRGVSRGLLEIFAYDADLDSGDVRELLGYLSSEASIALDNATLYRETAIQSEQLRAFVDSVILSEEQESRRLALDLHDGLVQTIVAAYQHLQTAQAWRERDPNTGEKELAHGIRLLRQAIYEARRLISGLRPAGLDDFGLVQALRVYAAELTNESWQLELTVGERWQRLPKGLEAALFRIVQEGVNNARKYSGANRAEVSLETTADQILVKIKDRGRGFDPDRVSSQPEKGLHMGLVGIRERARFWGGVCTVDSAPGLGTTIVVAIPRTRNLTTLEETSQ